MNESSTLTSGNRVCSGSGHQIIYMPPGDGDDMKDLDLRLVLLKNITQALLRNLAQRVEPTAVEEILVPATAQPIASPPANPEQRTTNPRCFPPFVIRRLQGTSLLVLLVGTVYFASKYLPYIDAHKNEVVDPSDSQDITALVATVALMLFWVVFFVALRLTCRYGFPVTEPALQ